MSRDDIIRMALEIGYPLACYETGPYVPPLLETLLNRAAAFEREACAITCEQTTASWTQHLYNEGVMDCVKAIRARGEK